MKTMIMKVSVVVMRWCIGGGEGEETRVGVKRQKYDSGEMVGWLEGRAWSGNNCLWLTWTSGSLRWRVLAGNWRTHVTTLVALGPYGSTLVH